MITRRISGANHYLGAPVGWKPDEDGECGHLAIRTQGDPRRGQGWCESAWEPTEKELEALNAGGSIILRVVGWQPPVAMYVEMPEDGQLVETAVTVEPDIRNATVCPKCEMAIGPLSFFCQNAGCPVREVKRK
jgi:hypothetical protein